MKSVGTSETRNHSTDRVFVPHRLTNREIAEQLSLSEKTIKNYVSQIYSKLHVQRRSQLARLATERRLRREQP